MDSRTFSVDRVNYQECRIRCGKECKTCLSGGHLAYYRYAPATEGAQRGTWVYFGKRAPVPSNAEPVKCQREGCDNHTHRLNQKYCSARCRVAANRAQ